MIGRPNVTALAIDTDGIEDNAGAFWRPDTLSHATKSGLNAMAYLDAHDSYSFFEGVNGLISTGPTCTNVNDLRMILITPPSTT